MHRLAPRLRSFQRLFVVGFLVACLSFHIACKKATNLNKEVAYVNSPQVILRDRLATIFEKKGTVKLGDKVYVLDHSKRFTLVRTESGKKAGLPIAIWWTPPRTSNSRNSPPIMRIRPFNLKERPVRR